MSPANCFDVWFIVILLLKTGDVGHFTWMQVFAPLIIQFSLRFLAEFYKAAAKRKRS
jgi:hypothetical protein